jgi:TRAP-type transport system periplasmic protein
MRLKRLVILLAVSGALLGGCDSSSNKATGARTVEPVVLTLANWERRDATVGEWVEAVERLSNGAMRIETHGSWRHGEIETDGGTLRDVRANRVDIGHIAVRAWDTLGVDAFRALEAPLLVDSLELENRVLTGDVGTKMLDGVRVAGVEPLALIPGPLLRPIGVSQNLLGASDYSGTVIGLRPSATHEATVQALGGRAVRIRSAGGLSGLDGTEIDLAGAERERYDERARSITADVVLWPRVTTLVMNRDAWQELTDEQRAVLRDAARVSITTGMERERRLERGGRQALCGRDFRFVRAGDAALAGLRGALEPVYRELDSDSYTREALERIRSLKGDLPPASAPTCGSAQDRATGTSDSPVVGTWEFNATREKVAAADRVTGETVGDNWGRYTFNLQADGRFEMRNDRFPGEPVGFGTWRSHGDTLVFRPGGQVSQGAGETWRYRWTLFRDSLVLHRLSRDAGPTSVTVAPMSRR